MSKSAPLLDDLLTLGGTLFGNLAEARHGLKEQARTHADSIARVAGLVSRDEFDAAFAMLAQARAVQEDLLERLEAIEEKLNLSSGSKNKNARKSSLPSLKQSKNRKGRK